ncbi:hypothetical protein Tco_0791516 [Tanacetum coccineum]
MVLICDECQAFIKDRHRLYQQALFDILKLFQLEFSVSDEDSDPGSKLSGWTRKCKKILALLAKEMGTNAKRNAGSQKRVKATRFKEKMMMCQQAEQCVPCKLSKIDWLEDTVKRLMNHKKIGKGSNITATMQKKKKRFRMGSPEESVLLSNDSFRFEHELKTEMHEDFEYVKSLEKEIDELEFEKADFSNIYDLLLEECVSKDVTCSYLHSLSDLNAYAELQCLYLHKVKECECLAQKLSNKQNLLTRSS